METTRKALESIFIRRRDRNETIALGTSIVSPPLRRCPPSDNFVFVFFFFLLFAFFFAAAALLASQLGLEVDNSSG